MNIQDFMARHGALPEQIPTRACLNQLLERMDAGLRGEGNIPMLPSFLSGQIRVEPGMKCCVLDAGGTNLRTATAEFDGYGNCRLENLTVRPMPGTRGELGADALYDTIAAPVRALGEFSRVGFCFSYNVTMDRNLDGVLDFWCKEVRAPEAVGKPVGASLRRALGGCARVHVLNDSVAAMLGAGDVQVGVILGTGVNVCYLERCDKIPKVPRDLKSDTMIISTEIGEFDAIPKSDFENTVIAATDAPAGAHAEKQCSGGYLGDVIRAAWMAAEAEGVLAPSDWDPGWGLAEISRMLTEGTGSVAAEIAALAIARAAKIGAIVCAGPILRAVEPGSTVRVAVEGSQYWKLTGFREVFTRELDALLAPEGVGYRIVKSDNACLIGAARAAFAEPM